MSYRQIISSLRYLPAVPVSRIQASLLVQTDWIASIEEKWAQLVEKVAPTTTGSLLLYLKASVEKKLFGETQSLMNSRLRDKNVLLNTVRTQVARVLYLRSPPCVYEIQPGRPLEDAVNTFPERTQPGSNSQLIQSLSERNEADNRHWVERSWKKRRYTFQSTQVREWIAATSKGRDPVQNKAIAERSTARRKGASRNSVAENVEKRGTVARLTRMEAIQTMTAATSPTVKRVRLHSRQTKSPRPTSRQGRDSDEEGCSGDSFSAL